MKGGEPIINRIRNQYLCQSQDLLASQRRTRAPKSTSSPDVNGEPSPNTGRLKAPPRAGPHAILPSRSWGTRGWAGVSAPLPAQHAQQSTELWPGRCA